MKATLKPLEGKYYGTHIQIDFEDGSYREVIELWNNDCRTPSQRELEKWDSDMDVSDIIFDNHYESKTTYERAIKIINALNAI